MGRKLKNDRVSKHTKKLLSAADYVVRAKPNKEKYWKSEAMVPLDFNLLENQYVVRKYFQKKHNVTLRELEILLYLYPKGYFSWQDYKNYPTSFSHRQIVSLIKAGYIKIFVEGTNLTKHVYTLTHSAQLKVCLYYKYLSGEKTVPMSETANPYMKKDLVSHDKKIANMFRIMAKKNKKEIEE